jgi:dihydrofolate reductase
MQIIGIVAISENGVIGNAGKLVWYLPADLVHFKNLTTGHAVIMGRKTFEGIGKILPNRLNIVVSSKPPFCTTLETAIDYAQKAGYSKAFIIGGAKLYESAMPLISKWYVTKIHAHFEGDTHLHLPYDTWVKTNEVFRPKDHNNPYNMTFYEYAKIPN